MKEEIESQQTLSGPGLFFHLDSHFIFCIDSISFHNSQFIGFLVFQDKVNSGQKLSGYNDDGPFGSDALLKLLVSVHHCSLGGDFIRYVCIRSDTDPRADRVSNE